MDKITIPIRVFESILIYAIRYALGRQSYAVTEVVGWIIKYKNYMAPDVRKLIARDIDHELRSAERMNGFCGMRCDHVRWQDVLEEIKLPYSLSPQEEAKLDFIEGKMIKSVGVPMAEAVAALAKMNRSILDMANAWHDAEDDIERISIMSDLQEAVRGIRR